MKGARLQLVQWVLTKGDPRKRSDAFPGRWRFADKIFYNLAFVPSAQRRQVSESALAKAAGRSKRE